MLSKGYNFIEYIVNLDYTVLKGHLVSFFFNVYVKTLILYIYMTQQH